MCGIVGYVGKKNATPILIDGLLSLEYRGYDSAGIATIENDKIVVSKDIGRVQHLKDLNETNLLSGTIGIAHTRWATHGKPSKENAHPHIDNTNSFAVVHNGIIENYNELRDFLISKGYKFLSDTDTEVIPNLIHYHFNNTISKHSDKFLSAVKSTTDDLKGSYAISVISTLFPNKSIVARKDSPLIIGTSKEEKFIASDIPAILPYTKTFYLLDNNEFAVISNDNIQFFNNNLNTQYKDKKIIEWDTSSAEKNGYEDFMLKEIFEQPTAIRQTIASVYRQDTNLSFEDLKISKEYLNNIDKIYIIACGTAMHAGLATQNIFEKFCQIPTIVDIASEFKYRDPLIDNKTLCIYISQSGETADTIAALKLAKMKGAKTISITNVYGSSITRESDFSIYTHAGPEIAVASTKAYTAQIVILSMLAIHFGKLLNRCELEELETLQSNILELPSKVEITLSNAPIIKEYANKIYTENDMFFLGRGTDYSVALEGSLKLKEISYIHSEAYPAGELKHGPIALIENDVTVIGIITNYNLVEKTLSNLQEVITRGAKTLVVTNQEISNTNFDFVLTIPKTNPLISPVLSVIPLQLLSYYIAKNRNLDVDKPRNLAKSVTVE